MAQVMREAVGVFDNIEQLDKAIAELETTAFPRQDISVLGNKNKVEEKFGSDTVKPEWVEDNPATPRGISIRPEEKTIGATVLIGVPAYFGGCIGALIVNPATNLILLGAVALGSLIGAGIGYAAFLGLKQRHNRAIKRQIDKGGLLLWVRTPGPHREVKAKDILRRYGAKHVHIHNIV